MNFLNLKPLEIILILVVVLLLFGAKRLPEMAKGIGQSVREFRKGIKDMKDDIASEAKVDKVEKQEAEKVG
jgi:sec-independent protein translocase protein TatA